MSRSSDETNPWDEQASRYRELIAEQERKDPVANPFVARTLQLLGDLAGRVVLDACCGEGFFARILAARGARVIGVDLSPRLIAIAREREAMEPLADREAIEYRIADLSGPLPDLRERFDLLASYLALDDVRDHVGFARTLYSLGKRESRAVLSFNNPYSSVVRGHIKDYFDSGALGTYGGLLRRGVKARYYHRMLEDYLDTFLAAGFQLRKLADVSPGQGDMLPKDARFPFGMIVALDKGAR